MKHPHDLVIYAVADTHGHLPHIPKCDICLIGGDVAPDYLNTGVGKGSMKQEQWLLGPFNDWLNSINAEHIVGIAGNHDFAFETSNVGNKLDWIYLEDRQVEIEGVHIHGIPWVPNLPFWAFYADDNTLDFKYALIKPDTDIVLSHGPARGYADKVGRIYKASDPPDGHVGSPAALNAIEKIQPKAFVSGHIHEGYGLYSHKETTIYGVSYLDERYRPVHGPVRIYLDT